MATPTATKTYRVRGMPLAKQIVEGLINHRQWFTFNPLLDTHFPDDQYEFELDAETPESGYNFTPTTSSEMFEKEDDYGLFIRNK